MEKRKVVSTCEKMQLFVVILLLVLAAACCKGVEVKAEDILMPSAYGNLTIDGVEESALVSTDTGFSRIFYDGQEIYVESYDDSFQILQRQTIPMELSKYGGFYEGYDAYYLVFGENNEAEDTSAEVIRVVKYSKSWDRQCDE